jgi:hypothetical protein
MVRGRYVKSEFRDFFAIERDADGIMARLGRSSARRRPSRMDRI